jgi:hypothetical protein
MIDDDEGSACVQEAPLDPSDENETTLSSPLLPSNGLRERASTTTSRDVEEGRQSRILDRSAAFHQSRGRWGVERLSRGHRARRSGCCCLGRIWNEWILGDWFHRLAYQRTCVLMTILFVIYTSIVVFFGFVYLAVSILGQEEIINPDDGSKKIISFCDMDINDHMEALYFSLSTMTTIGYGVSDYYFGGCWTPLLLVLWQVCSAITFDAVAVGLLFHRISRGRKRGRTIAFSDKAVVRRIKGIPHLMFRIGELRRYHLLEATVRCYCIRHERLPVQAPTHMAEGSGENLCNGPQTIIETTHFISRQVKLLHPDENYGSHIWMGLPQVVVHRLDEKSPLTPSSPAWYDADGVAHSYPRSIEEKQSKQDPLAPPTPDNRAFALDTDGIESFLLDRDTEIVVLVEGTDEGTGAATQARHSYKAADIAWNHTFLPCVRPYTSHRQRGRSDGDPVCSIDFSKFHDIVPAPADCEACAYIPQ